MIKFAQISLIDEQKVELLMDKNDSCADCKSGCSDGFLNFLFPKSMIIAVSKVEDLKSQFHLFDKSGFFSEKYKQGDVVGMKFNESQLFNLALVLYGFPILLIVVFLITFYYLFSLLNLNSDIGGIIGLSLGLVISKTVIKFNQNKFKPQVEFFK